MKYKALKEITGKAIIQCLSYKCDEGLNKALKKIGYDEVVNWNGEAEEWVKENIVDGIDWLLNNGFISKINYSDDKFYFAAIADSPVCRLTKINNDNDNGESKYLWVNFGADNKMSQSSWHFESISKSISAYHRNGYEVKEFNLFEEAMEHYFPNNWKS